MKYAIFFYVLLTFFAGCDSNSTNDPGSNICGYNRLLLSGEKAVYDTFSIKDSEQAFSVEVSSQEDDTLYFEAKNTSWILELSGQCKEDIAEDSYWASIIYTSSLEEFIVNRIIHVEALQWSCFDSTKQLGDKVIETEVCSGSVIDGEELIEYSNETYYYQTPYVGKVLAGAEVSINGEIQYSMNLIQLILTDM